MLNQHRILTRTLQWILYGLLGTEAVLFVYALYRFYNSSMLRTQFAMVALLFVFFIIGSYALAHLIGSFIGITQLILTESVFTQKTVRLLKAISWDCLLIAICFFLNFVVNLSNATYEIFKVDMTGIHTDIEYVIFAFAGCFIWILAQVFEQAVQYKEDHDLTI